MPASQLSPSRVSLSLSSNSSTTRGEDGKIVTTSQQQQQQQQQQFVLTMIGSHDSDQIGYFAASMGLMIPMRATHYHKGAMTTTATVTTTTTATASYAQLLYGTATAHM